jgi:hypothetical protein
VALRGADEREEEIVTTKEEAQRRRAVIEAARQRQAIWEAKHGGTQTPVAEKAETGARLPDIGNELVEKKRRLEQVVRRRCGSRRPDWYTTLEVPLSNGSRVRWLYWPVLQKTQIIERAAL